MIETAKKAKKASLITATLDTDIKNAALNNIAKELTNEAQNIFEANNTDLMLAKELVENGELSQSTFNRLKLDENKFRDMVQGVLDVAKLPDPVNKVLLKRELDKDLILEKISSMPYPSTEIHENNHHLHQWSMF